MKIKLYDAQQVTVSAQFRTGRFGLSVLRHTRKGEAWHQIGLTRKQLRELGRSIADVLTEARAHDAAEQTAYETAQAERSGPGIVTGFDTEVSA